MPVSAWIMLVVGCLILYGGLAYCLALAAGIIGPGKGEDAVSGEEE